MLNASIEADGNEDEIFEAHGLAVIASQGKLGRKSPVRYGSPSEEEDLDGEAMASFVASTPETEDKRYSFVCFHCYFVIFKLM